MALTIFLNINKKTTAAETKLVVEERSLEKRADMFVGLFRKHFGWCLISPHHIYQGIEPMNKAFLAILFTMCNGLEEYKARQLVDNLLRACDKSKSAAELNKNQPSSEKEENENRSSEVEIMVSSITHTWIGNQEKKEIAEKQREINVDEVSQEEDDLILQGKTASCDLKFKAPEAMKTFCDETPKVLLETANLFLKESGLTHLQIGNLSGDLVDGKAYANLLHLLSPQCCSLVVLKEKNYELRSQEIIEMAKSAGILAPLESSGTTFFPRLKLYMIIHPSTAGVDINYWVNGEKLVRGYRISHMLFLAAINYAIVQNKKIPDRHVCILTPVAVLYMLRLMKVSVF